MKSASAIVLVVLTASPAMSVELRSIDVRRGTDGLTAAPVVITNATGSSITCIGELAHWYSSELASIATGERTTIDLWHDPATGTLSALNDKRENMPVESLWCGLTGRAYVTRALIALPRDVETAPSLTLTCAMGQDRIVCE